MGQYSLSNKYMYSESLPILHRPGKPLQMPPDARLCRDAQHCFIPYVNERDSVGRLLSQPYSPYTLQLPRTVLLSPSSPKTKSVFFRTAEVTSAKLKRARYVSPPVGFYNPPSSPKAFLHRPPTTSTLPSPKHRPLHSTDMLDRQEIYTAVDRHVAVVDMARLTARARAAAMTEEEKWLFAPKFELPEHLRKFKGFYDVSGLDSHKIEDPTSLFAKVKATKSTIKAKIAEIHTSKRTLDAKLFR